MVAPGGHNGNGYHQGNSRDGDNGGYGGSPPRAGRAGMRLLQTLVEAGQMAADDLATVKAYALAVIGDTSSSPRDRLRASELLASIAFKGGDKAVEADKIERLDAGTATENISVYDVAIPGVSGRGV